jgi:molybdate transport system substrate-binding protein
MQILRNILSGLLLSLLLLPAVAKEAPAPQQAPTATPTTVTIFAAASLKNALDAIAEAYRAKTGVEAKISYGSSATLAKQIEAGAPADLFISADVASMDYLAERELIALKTRTDLLGNTLVLVAPKSSKLDHVALTKEGFTAALGDGRIATGDVASVPVGKYAKAALGKIGLWEVAEPHFAFTDNVRSALVFVAREEAALGVVYQTDANAEPKVKVVATFPHDSHPPIVYPIALAANAKGDAPAKLLAYMKGPDARAAFTTQGFKVLP